MKNTKKGFTLIELLVVIAIIGILSAIVLASLSTARSKANDAKIQGQLSSMRAAAEIYYSNNSSYGPIESVCTAGLFADPTSGMAALASSTAGMAGANMTCGVTTSPAAWAAGATLSTGKFWCVDSSGKSVSENSALAAGTAACS